MITGEKIKKLRDTAGLTIEEMARAIYVENYARYESDRIDTKGINTETLERIANVCGYTVELNLIEKKKHRAKEDFYKDKSSDEIIKMNDDDMIEYLFIKCDDSTIARICNQSEHIISMLGLEEVRKLLSDSIKNKSKKVLFHILENTYGSNEEIFFEFADEINKYLLEETDMDNEQLEKIHYIQADWEYFNTSLYQGWSYDCNSLKFLDCDKKDLNIDILDFMIGDTLDSYLEPWFCSNEIGEYLSAHKIFKIKY